MNPLEQTMTIFKVRLIIGEIKIQYFTIQDSVRRMRFY